MDNIQSILNELVEIDGVTQTQVVSDVGVELYKNVRKGCSYLDVFEVLRKMKALSREGIENLFKKKDVKNIILNIEDININIYYFKSSVALVVICGKESNLGKIRLVVRKNEPVFDNLQL